MVQFQPTDLPAGFVLDDYEVVGVLGHGGFANTYRVRDLKLRHECAIKEFFPRDLAHRDESLQVYPSPGREKAFEQSLASFISEARTMVRLRAPGLVTVLRFFEQLNTAYIVMDLVEGRTLADLLEEHAGDIPTDDLREVALYLLDTVDYIHSQNVVHRDIKPSNIIITPDGRPVLLDFGAARHMIDGRLNSATQFVSQSYAPIEQYRGEHDQGPPTDLYSIGAVLYYALAGKPPVDARDRQTIPYVPLASELPELDDPLIAAIDSVLAFDKEDRPQSVQEFRPALMPTTAETGDAERGISIADDPAAQDTAAADGIDPPPSAESPPEGGTDPARPPAIPNRGLFWMLSMVAVLVLAVLVVSTTPALKERAMAILDGIDLELAGLTDDFQQPTVTDTGSLRLAIASSTGPVRIRLASGRYEGPLTIDKPVTLIGDESAPEKTVITSTSRTCLTLGPSEVELRGIALMSTAGFGGTGACLDVRSGQHTLRNLITSSTAGPAIQIAGGARVDASDIRVLKAGSTGIVARNASFLQLSRTGVTQTTGSGIRIESGSTLTLSTATIVETGAAGLVLQGGSRAEIKGINISGVAGSAIEVGSNSHLTIQKARVRNARQAGLYLYEGSASVSDSIIDDTARSGIVAQGPGEVMVTDSSITASREFGVYLTDGVQGVVEKMTIRNNRRGGVAVDRQARATIRDTTLSGNGVPQIARSGDRGVTTSGNSIRR